MCAQPDLHSGPMFRVSRFIWMAYLSLRVMVRPLTPFCVLLLEQACCGAAAGPRSKGMCLLKCVYLGVQQERVVNQCDHWRAPRYCFTRRYTYTHTHNHSHIPTD